MSIGKEVVSSDGSMAVNGIGDSVTFIGTSVLKGTDSVVSGAAKGVFSVGKGFFSGVTSVGKGLAMLFKARSLHEIEISHRHDENICRSNIFSELANSLTYPRWRNFATCSYEYR